MVSRSMPSRPSKLNTIIAQASRVTANARMIMNNVLQLLASAKIKNAAH